MSTIFQILENEFCPPLDSALLAVLLAEVEKNDNNAQILSPSSPQVEALRADLRELAVHADAAQLFELSDFNSIEDTISTVDNGLTGTTADTTFSSRSSVSSAESFSSPLGFLQASLPDVATERLKSALRSGERDGKEMDMWDVIADILSEESIRELEERGLGALGDSVCREDVQWETLSPKSKKKSPRPQTVKRKQKRPTKITIVDIRQRNHGQPQYKKKPTAASHQPLPDLWTQVQSIATAIATYLPQPPSFFLSYLHSPNYATPYQALCAALESICKDTSYDFSEDSTLLFNLLDILFSQYEPLDSEQRTHLVEETEMCIRATNGRGDDVLDIVELLRELNVDAVSGRWEIGVYHVSPDKPPPSPIIKPGLTSNQNHLASVTPSRGLPAPPTPSSPTTNRSESKSNPYEWQTIPTRQVSDNEPHRLAQYIPAYSQNKHKLKRVGGGDNVGELSGPGSKVMEHKRKQEEYLKQAAKMWQRGNKKSWGGQIAFFYAEKAREFQAMAKQEALENARIMVNSKRSLTGELDEIDLHGTTVFEAVTIVKEVLEDFQCSQTRPLKIITGKGAHSAHKQAVLKPAVKNALEEDGWIVGTWGAGLEVSGRIG